MAEVLSIKRPIPPVEGSKAAEEARNQVVEPSPVDAVQSERQEVVAGPEAAVGQTTVPAAEPLTITATQNAAYYSMIAVVIVAAVGGFFLLKRTMARTGILKSVTLSAAIGFLFLAGHAILVSVLYNSFLNGKLTGFSTAPWIFGWVIAAPVFVGALCAACQFFARQPAPFPVIDSVLGLVAFGIALVATGPWLKGVGAIAVAVAALGVFGYSVWRSIVVRKPALAAGGADAAFLIQLFWFAANGGMGVLLLLALVSTFGVSADGLLLGMAWMEIAFCLAVGVAIWKLPSGAEAMATSAEDRTATASAAVAATEQPEAPVTPAPAQATPKLSSVVAASSTAGQQLKIRAKPKLASSAGGEVLSVPTATRPEPDAGESQSETPASAGDLQPEPEQPATEIAGQIADEPPQADDQSVPAVPDNQTPNLKIVEPEPPTASPPPAPRKPSAGQAPNVAPPPRPGTLPQGVPTSVRPPAKPKLGADSGESPAADTPQGEQPLPHAPNTVKAPPKPKRRF